MSKAMDALEVLQGYGDVAGQGMASVLGITQAIAILRDYITTTEAVGEVPDDVGALLDKLRGIWKTDEDGDGALLIAFIAKRETAWAIALAGEQLAHETDLTQSAARIKELEEALKRIDVRKDDDAWWIHVDGKPHAGILRLSEKPSMCADAFIEWEAIRKAALSGARKVGP